MKRVIWILIFSFLILFPHVNALNEILDADRSFTFASTDGGSGICYSKSNNTIFSADHDTPSISQFAPDGTLLGSAFSTLPQNNQPDKGIVCLNSTHLLIPDGEVVGEVQVWTKKGVFVENIDLAANSPSIKAIATMEEENQSYIWIRDGLGGEIDSYKKSTTTSGWDYERNFSIPFMSGGDVSRCLAVVKMTQTYHILIGLGNRNNGGEIINVSRFNITGNFGAYDNYAKRESHPAFEAGFYACAVNTTTDKSIQFFYINESNLKLYQASLNVTPTNDTAPPKITFYNMTSEGGSGCTNWNTDKTNACLTSDTTPTVAINTSEPANCRIGISDLNYSDLGSSRDCGPTTGSTNHTCTLIPQDELLYENSNIYIGCRDTSDNHNENRTSTSSALRLNITLETYVGNALELGIKNSLISGYTVYTNQKVYSRNSANNQSTGRFDKVVKKLNKIWAFNWLSATESYINMLNITPVFYTWEFANKTNGTITTNVELLINSTK